MISKNAVATGIKYFGKALGCKLTLYWGHRNTRGSLLDVKLYLELVELTAHGYLKSTVSNDKVCFISEKHCPEQSDCVLPKIPAKLSSTCGVVLLNKRLFDIPQLITIFKELRIKDMILFIVGKVIENIRGTTSSSGALTLLSTARMRPAMLLFMYNQQRPCKKDTTAEWADWTTAVKIVQKNIPGNVTKNRTALISKLESLGKSW